MIAVSFCASNEGAGGAGTEARKETQEVFAQGRVSAAQGPAERPEGDSSHAGSSGHAHEAGERAIVLYLVQMTLNPGVNLNAVQRALRPAHSWYRLSGESWVVCTQEGTAVWAQRLAAVTRPKGSLFICALNPTDYEGWMTDEFWNWYREHSGQV